MILFSLPHFFLLIAEKLPSLNNNIFNKIIWKTVKGHNKIKLISFQFLCDKYYMICALGQVKVSELTPVKSNQ